MINKCVVFSLHENLEVENVQPTSDLVVLAKHFVNILKERSEADGTLKVHKDSAYTENPMERDDIEESIKVNVDNIYTSAKTSNI